MGRKLKHALPWLLALISLGQAAGPFKSGQDQSVPEEFQDLILGDFTRLFKLQEGEVKHFRVNIPSDYDGQQDLVVKVQASDQFGDPDLFISRTNPRPTNQANSEWSCATYGKDICSIGHKNITSSQTFYIGVKCMDSCRFNVMPQLVSETIIEDAQEMQIDFGALETKIFRFKIPANTGTRDKQNQVTSVTILASPILPQTDSILLAASTQQDVVPTSASRKGVPGWRKGQTLRLSENGEDWCTDCWITILLDVTDPGKYSIVAKSNIGIQQLQTDHHLDDVAFTGDKICYKYNVQQADTDLILNVRQYSGLISFTINPRKPADSYEEGAFKHVSPQNTALVVSATQRKSLRQEKGLWYICVHPHLTSTYTLMVREIPSNQEFLRLRDSFEENGEVVGKGMKVYVYKVPPLNYFGEDIQLDIRLTTLSGTTPILAMKQCQETKDFRKCGQGIQQSDVLGSKSSYQKANVVGNDLSLSFDHDEKTCQDVFNGECHYTVVVIGNGEQENVTTYEIKISHAQNNYFQLQEGQLITDFVNMGTSRLYMFSLPTDSKVKNVTFKLNTIHGDADIYVSRNNTKPNKISYEKSSFRSNVAIDEVYFDGPGIATNYYISVYSYQYSTYNLVVKVDREGQKNFENVPVLTEGIAFRGSIHNEDSFESFKINIKQLPGYEKSIKISVTPIQKNVVFYVNQGEVATDKKYTWTSSSGSLEILTKDPKFRRDGTYYVTVYPKYQIWSRLTDDYYKYLIVYTTQDSYIYMQSQVALEHSQGKNSVHYYRHFITKVKSDISVAMTVFNGNPVLFISVNPNNKLPDSSNFDYSSMNQSLISGSKGKAIFIPYSILQKKNWACGSQQSLLSSEMDPCALFATVQCVDECRYSLKLSYEKGGPQQLIVGVPQHDIVKEGGYSYFYMNVREDQTQEIYSVLDSIDENTDLYVRLQENPQNYYPEQWARPDDTNYDYKSTLLLDQDVIRIQKKDLTDCFKRYIPPNENSQKECGIIFAVYAPQLDEDEDPANNKAVRFNFVVYTDIISIMNGYTMSGQVDEGDFQYYLYQSVCSDCPIIVSLSTFATGDPDLYITIGDANLPTKQNYDIVSSTFRSEMVTIDLQSSAIKAKKMTSLKGSYIIGVYGNKKSSFSVSVTQEKNPVLPLDPGKSIKILQEPFEATYFVYYHLDRESDFKIQLDLKSGAADLYVKTFIEEEGQNLADRIPRSKRDAQWILSNITPVTPLSMKELLILNQERNFCESCYYVIGVLTKELRTEYTLSALILDADCENSMLLRIGDAFQHSIKAGDRATFRFMIDEREDITISQTMNSGYVDTYIQLDPNTDDYVEELHGTMIININTQDSIFYTETMYYMVIVPTEDSEITVQVTQRRQIIQLSDGQPYMLQYIDGKDSSKPMIFMLPDGNQTVNIQVKQRLSSLYPGLYVRFVPDLNEKQMDRLQFPPTGKSDYETINAWDLKFKSLKFSKQYNNIIGGKAALLLNLFSKNELVAGGQYQIIVTSNSVMQLTLDTMYSGSLPHPASYMIYMVDPKILAAESGYIVIEFAQCVGDSAISVVEDIASKKIVNLETQSKFDAGRQYIFFKLPLSTLYLMVKPNDQSLNEDQVNPSTDYLVRARYRTGKDFMIQYYFQVDNQISFEKHPESDSAILSWHKILYSDSQGAIYNPGAVYNVIIANDSRVKLDSICTIRPNNTSVEKFIYTTNTNYTLTNVEEDKSYYVNVVAQFKPNNGLEDEIVPYKPTEIIIRSKTSIVFIASKLIKGLNHIVLILSFVVGLISVGLLCKKCRENKEPYYVPKTYMEYEMTSIASGGNVGKYERPVDLDSTISSTH